MPVAFENYTHSFTLKTKHIFVPNELSLRIGYDIKRKVEKSFTFPNYYFHLRNGGHVAAIHLHRQGLYFGKVDLKNFFYSIGRNRVSRALQDIGIRRSGHYARWSCVRSPYLNPRYALPLGFVQSPILASLVLHLSEAGKCLEKLKDDVTCSVYMDDISFSGANAEVVNNAIDLFSRAVVTSQLQLNPDKTVLATQDLLVFACHVQNLKSYVSSHRISAFYSKPRSPESAAGFESYCESVSSGSA